MSDSRALAVVTPMDPPSAPALIPWAGDDGDLLTRLVRQFEAAEEASAEARREAEKARDYYDSIQWTSIELETLRGRGQPALTIPYVKRKIDLMRGLERRARSEPKAMPRTPNEDDRADAATQALRFVSDATKFHEVRSAAYENMLVEGFGAAEVVAEPGRGMDVEVRVNHVPWDRVFYDPHSRRPDFLDARYVGVVLWMDRDEALDLYPGAESVLTDTFASASGSAFSDTYADRPGTAWCDNRRTRVRVVQSFFQSAADRWEATFTKGGFLAPAIRSPYLGPDGRSACRLILQSAYVARDNTRYGIVRDMIGLQDEINKRRSSALHNVIARPVVMEVGAVDDVDEMKRELAKPNGVVIVNGQGLRFEVGRGADFTPAHLQLLQHATAEMQAQGANASLAGKDGRDLSGRAILAQQAGGQAEIEPLVDGLRSWTRRIHEAVWMRVRQFWTAERWVRVTDEQGKPKFVGLNREVTLGDDLTALAERDPDKAAAWMRQMGIVPNDPRLNRVLRVENNVQDLDVDITIEDGPDVPTLQAEEFATLTQLAGTGFPIPPDVIIAASNLRNKDELLERLKAAPPPSPPTPPAVEAMQVAKVRQTEAQATLAEATAKDRNASAVERMARVERESLADPNVPVGPRVVPMGAPPSAYPPPLG